MLSANLGFAVAGPNGGQDFAVAADATGNVYALGTDAVYKFTAAGTKLWAAPYTASSGINQKEGLAVDSNGNVFITGNFGNTASSPAIFGGTSLASAGGSDGFLAKLDTSGNFLWAKSFGGTGSDSGYGVAVDAAGNAIVTGDFSATATFGAGANAVTLQCAGWTDAFVAKYNANGNLSWAEGIGGTSPDEGLGVAVDSQGDAYVTGQFSGTVDFDPAHPGAHQLTTFFGAAYVLKLDGSGNYLWAEELNGANLPQGDGRSIGDAITVDSAGNVYATGIFGGPVNLNPSGGTDIVSADFVFPDAFVLKLDATGAFAWAADLHNVSGANPFGGFGASGIAVDGQGNVYTTGNFQGLADFDPGANTDDHLSAGGVDAYVSVLDRQGNFAWDAIAGETGSDFGWGIAATGAGKVYVAGSFSNTMDFNPGPGIFNVSAHGLWDGFVWGLNYPQQAIAGVVWNDQNSDGVRQSGEPGLAGVSVALYQGTPGSGVLAATTVSDSLGLYSFKGLTSGVSYYIQVYTPLGDALTTQNAGGDPTLNSNVATATGRSAAMTLAAGQTAVANAGFQVSPSAPTFGLAFGIKTVGFTEGSSIIADAAGNFYVAGSFDGTSVFGSGPGAVTLSTGANNDFVAKYSPSGALIWVRRAVSAFWQYDPKIQLDAFGDVYVSGSMTGQTTFGSTVLAASSNTAFLWKLDNQGNTLWAKSVIGRTSDNSVGMAVDPLGDAYVVGAFAGTSTIATSPNPTTLTSVGDTDIFIVKYDSSGAPLWAKSYGTKGSGFSDDGADSVAVDPSGNAIVTGSFDNTLQLGGFTLPGGFPQTDFVAKFNSADGGVAWAVEFHSTSSSGPSVGDVLPLNRIAVDAAGNVYTTGVFDGKLQLDPTNGTDLTANGTNATFISKLDNNGSFVWGKAFLPGSGGYDVEGLGIAVDQQGDVYTTGEFAQTLNFNPAGTPAVNLTAIGASYDIYVSELNNNGNFVSAQQFGGSSEDEGTAIAVDAAGSVYVTGVSRGPANFSPPPGTFNIGASGEQDIFALKLAPAANSPLINSPPSFAIVGAPQQLLENAGPQIVPGFISILATGPTLETNETLTAIVTNDNSALFSVKPSINPVTGTLTYVPAANAAGVAHVTVAVRNNGGTSGGGNDTSASQTFTINITPVNQPPSFSAGAAQFVDEDGGAQTVAGWAQNISAGPPNESGQALDFQVSSDNSSLFSSQPAIDATGTLTYTPAPNAYGVAHVTVQLHDNGGTLNGGINTSAVQTFTITVNPVNDAPSFVAGGNQTVNEDAGPQIAGGWATAISAGPNEASQTLNFLISSDNPGLFSAGPSIDPLTGNLTYTPAANANGVTHVTVQLHDNGGTLNGGVDTSAAQTFTITVNPVNDAPSFTAGGDQMVNEDAGPQTAPGWAANISDGPNETGQTLSFLVSNDNSALFASQPVIDPITGDLTYTPAADANGLAIVTVSLHDDGGTLNGGVDTSAAQTFTITVNPVNDAPSFTAGGDQTVNEDAGPQIVPAWATNLSKGPANEIGQTLDFLIDSDNPALFSSQPAIDPTTGDLSYTSAANANGVAHVTVQLHDDGGTDNGGVDTSVAQTFTITVNPVNDAPSFTGRGDQTVNEDAGPQTVNAWATAISDGPNETGQALNFLISSDNSGLFSAGPTIDPGTGKLTYTPAANANGVAHVTVQLHDDGGTANGGVDTSAAQSFTITVNPVNDAPSFTAGSNQIINEDAGPQSVLAWATNLSKGPADEAGQTLNFLVSNDNASLFSAIPAVDPVTGTLTYTPAANASGVARVTVRLHDDGGTANGGVDTSAAQTFTITVNPVNDAPSFTAGGDQSVNEDAGPQTATSWAAAISDGPNEVGQALNFLISSDNAGLFSAGPAIDPSTGNLTYTPAANANGVAHVTVMLHDNGGTLNGGVDTSAAQTFTITVNPVNDAPSFTAGGNQSVNEDVGPQTIAPWATNISAGPNESGQSLNFLVASDNPTLFSVQPSIDSNGALSYTPAAHASGLAHLTVRLHDDGGTANGGVDTSAAQTFTIAVNFVNRAPSFDAGPNQSVFENAGAQIVTGWATNVSQGAFETGQTLNFVVGVDNAALFSVQPAIDPNGTLSFTPAPNATGVATLTVQLHDNAGTTNGGVDTSAQQTFTITVNGVNQPPSFTMGPKQTVNEDDGPQTVAAWATNISDGANESGQALNFLVTADNPNLFSAGPAVDAAGNLTFTPALYKEGTARVTVALHDDGGTANGGIDTSAVQTFQIVINPVNHAPTIAAPISNPTLDENAADLIFGVAGVFDDVDIPNGDHLTLSLAGNDNATLLNASLADGKVTLHLSPNAFGTAHLDLRATDGAGLAIDDRFTATVNAVNQPPSFIKGVDQRVQQNSGPVTVYGWAKSILAGPANEASQTLSFQVTSDTNTSMFLVAPSVDPLTGALSFTPASGVSGTATITLVLKDNGGTANDGHDTSAPQSLQIIVDSPPVAVADTFVLSDSSSNLAATAGVLTNDSAPNGYTLSAQLVSGPSHGTLSLHADGSFTYVKRADFAGMDQFTYRASDGLAQSSVVTVRILSYQASIIEKLYEQVLHRGPEDAGLLYWTNRIQSGDAYGAVAQGIFESNERLDPIITQYYQDFLLRPAEPAGLAYWRDQVWKRDGGPENVIAGMISSPEFFQSAGGTNADWVQALYQRLLNRPADVQGLGFWDTQLQNHVETEQQVVLGFTESDENHKALINGFYQQYLQRAPNPLELESLLEEMRAGSTERDIQIEIINTDEYGNTPPPPAGGVADRLSP